MMWQGGAVFFFILESVHSMISDAMGNGPLAAYCGSMQGVGNISCHSVWLIISSSWYGSIPFQLGGMMISVLVLTRLIGNGSGSSQRRATLIM
jgi:hypothetical protein